MGRIKPVEERIALSSPYGETRAVAEGPELIACSADARGKRWNAGED